MKKLSLLFVFALVFSFISGCSSKYMQPADPVSAQTAPSPDESKIVFMRATTFGGAIESYVVEIKDGKMEHICNIASGGKVAHLTTPGKHIYMTGAENSELMEADLAGGKTYYVYISPRIGFFMAQFVFVPVTQAELSSDTLKKDLAWCEWQERNAAADDWFKRYHGMLTDQLKSAQLSWEKNPDDRKFLKQEDGTKVPFF